MDILPDRSAETLAPWLKVHGRNVEFVSRDRYRPYIEGASAPEAVQVADRFHVFKNLYDAVEKLVERNQLRELDAEPEAPPTPNTSSMPGTRAGTLLRPRQAT